MTASTNLNPHKEFNADLEENGYHIFSKIKSKKKGFYPDKFPKYDDIDISNLNEGDVVIIRIFFLISTSPVLRADGGYVDVEVESIENDIIWGNILTKLPDSFPLAKDTTIELNIDEILKIVK